MKRRIWAIPTALTAVVCLSNLVSSDVRTAEYKGSATCKMCHKIMHKDIVAAFENTAHPKALQKADAEGAIVADFSTNTAFTKDKVAFVLGKGTNQQAYLDADLKVLPAKWMVKTKTWTPTPAVDGSTQCVGCHTVGFDAEKKTYVEAGVGCEACHGPGSDHTSGDKAGIVNPKNLDPAKRDMVCGQCHSLGKDKSGNFAHPVGFRPGDDLTAKFVDAKPTKPGLNQQYSEHFQSKHAKAQVGCTTCHDPHNVALYTTASKPPSNMSPQLRKPVNDQCMECHATTVKDMATHAPNAAADATCATCHMPDGQHTFGKAK